MNINYVKKYSAALGRDMEYKTYGDKGHPVLVFPSQDGRFYDYQDFDMVGVLSSYIDRGQIRLICADSIDRETWSDMGGDHHRRIIMCVGQGSWEDELLDSTRQMDALLKEKNIPAWIDYWGYDSAHDWAWWRKQIVYFIDKLLAPDTDYVI